MFIEKKEIIFSGRQKFGDDIPITTLIAAAIEGYYSGRDQKHVQRVRIFVYAKFKDDLHEQFKLFTVNANTPP